MARKPRAKKYADTITPSDNGLVAHFAQFDDAASGADGSYPVPSWVQLMPPSGFAGRDGRGPYSFDASAVVQSFIDNQGPIAVDYDHQSISAMVKSGPVPAAGWIESVAPVTNADGTISIYAQIEWTDQANDLIASRQYRGISPVLKVNSQNRSQIDAIAGAGLTNTPNLPGLALLNSAATGGLVSGPGTATSDSIPILSKDLNKNSSDYRGAENGDHMLPELRKTLKLADDADEKSVIAAVTALVDAHAKATADIAAHSAQVVDLAVYAPRSDFEAMSVRATAAEEKLKALAVEAHSAKAESAVSDAIKAGKFLPAQREGLLAFATASLDKFIAMAEATPTLAVAHARISGASETQAQALTPEQMAMATMAGVSHEKLAETLRKQNAA